MTYIRIKWRTNKDGTRRGYKYLVESYREGKKVKQRTLEYLGPVGVESQTSTSSQVGTTKPKKVGTTFENNLKTHFDQINESGFKGNMVPIPDIWRKMKREGYSKKEFRQELLKLERKREIDLQTASDPKLISKKDREGGFYLKDGDYYDHDERPGPTKRGYINYVVWRR